MCVQSLNDSRGLAIRITYRISLRSSSLWEPRHPLLKVVVNWFLAPMIEITHAFSVHDSSRSTPVMPLKNGWVLDPYPNRGHASNGQLTNQSKVGSSCMYQAPLGCPRGRPQTLPNKASQHQGIFNTVQSSRRAQTYKKYRLKWRRV